MRLLIAMLIAYLSGSFPSAVVVARRVGGLDIFKSGSGNPGASNIYRLLGLKWAVLVLLIDVLKGYLPAYLSGMVFLHLEQPPWINLRGEVMVSVGSAAVLGHLFPIYTGFRGGKGVATICGVLFAVAPLASSATLISWGVVIKIKKIFSVASLTASIVFPFALYFLEGERQLTIFGWGMIVPLILVFTHYSNLRRLIQHGELPMKEDEGQ